MNKKFSTLMLGMLLTSAFASADNINTNVVQEVAADKLKSGKSYFVVADVDGNNVYSSGDLFLSVTKNGDDYNFEGVSKGDVESLTWTFTETPIGANYYYSLKNEELGIYLTVADKQIVADEKVDNGYFKAYDAAETQYGKFVQTNLLVDVANSLALKINSGSVSLVSRKAIAPKAAYSILLCEYEKNQLTSKQAAETLNDVKGGAGFNLAFSVDNKYEWANDILTDLNLKAFYVQRPIQAGNTNDFVIPAGVYFATEYPASLSSTNQITDKADFYACTFVAVNPDSNYNINAAASEGVGFELMTIAGSEMNFYSKDDKSDDASVKGEVYVGNACFSVSEPDPMREAGKYNFELKSFRHLKDLTKTEHITTTGLSLGYVADQNKNYLITNEEPLGFTLTNSTLYDVTKLLKSEDAPSIYTMQFVSDIHKEEDANFAGEKGQYLTVGSFGGLYTNYFSLSAVEEMNAEDPMFQFVITAVDKDEKTVTFANRQTKFSFKVSLYENADGSFTVYGDDVVNLSRFNYSNTNDGNLAFVPKSLQNTKVVLNPITVEDKFATFVNRVDGAGLVTFELAKNIDDAPEFYVGIQKKANGDVKYEGGELRAYTDEATQFELEKVKLNNGEDKVNSIVNTYVYLKDERVLNSTKADTVAYYTYRIKAFTSEGKYYINGNTSSASNNTSFAIKNNVDGSVSLISSIDVKNENSMFLGVVESLKDDKKAWANYFNYDLYVKLNEGLKTFMIDEDPTLSYEAIPQHVSFEAVRGGFLTKDENSDARLAIAGAAAEELTFWLDTVHSDRTVPYFYILKNGAFMYNAADSADYYNDRGNYRFNLENKKYADGSEVAKLIFKAGELVTSDTLRTVVDGQSVLVAEEDNAPKKIKGGLYNFQFQIVRVEKGSDEYVIRQNGKYVGQYNNYFYMVADKDAAYRFVIEKQAAPTANEGIEVSEVKVIAGNGQITIMGAAGKKVVVSNILGKVVASQTISSDNATIAVPSGIVAVAVEGEAAVKAVVK